MKQAVIPALVPDENQYPAVLNLFGGSPKGRIIDVPAGHGAFAQELLKLGYDDIHCLDLHSEQFMLKDSRVRFIEHNVLNGLPYEDDFFDYAFSIEGLEHFDSPFTFVSELCRVVKPGGRLYLTTPNNMSVDARLKFLVSGYFPRFLGLMKEPHKVLAATEIHAHISPIYFWQLNYFLMRGGVRVRRVSTNTLIYKKQPHKRVIERMLAKLIQRNVKRRGFNDEGVTSEAMLFGDCIIIEAEKQQPGPHG
jgi:SAM-dependent methyltransferase